MQMQVRSQSEGASKVTQARLFLEISGTEFRRFLFEPVVVAI